MSPFMRGCVHKEPTAYISVKVILLEALCSQGIHFLYYSERGYVHKESTVYIIVKISLKEGCVQMESTVYVIEKINFQEELCSQGIHCLYYSESHPPGGAVFKRNLLSIL